MVSTIERTRRTTRGISGITIARMTVIRLAPDRDTSAIASRMAGIAISPSITRMMIASASRKYPTRRPITNPIATLATATLMPTISETRAP